MKGDRPRFAKHFRIFLFLIAFLLGFLIFLFFTPILPEIGKYLVVKDKLFKADAIVVLQGGKPARILEAVDIYRADFSKKIVLPEARHSDGWRFATAQGITILERSDVSYDVARQLGIPEKDILLLAGACNSTFDEASLIEKYTKENPINSIIIVTSAYHTRRAKAVFCHVLDENIDIRVIPTKYEKFSVDSWWSERRFRKVVVLEYLKIFTFWVGL